MSGEGCSMKAEPFVPVLDPCEPVSMWFGARQSGALVLHASALSPT